MCEIPVDKELDLKKAAKHFGEKKLEMLPSKLLTATTGYIEGGCSPGRDEERISDSYRCFCGAAGKNRRQRRESRTADGAAGEKALQEITGACFVDLTVRHRATGRRAEYINCQVGEPGHINCCRKLFGNKRQITKDFFVL